MSCELAISPSGQLHLERVENESPEPIWADEASRVFALSRARGLEFLAGKLLNEALPASLSFWRELGRKFFTVLCHQPDFAPNSAPLPVPPETELSALAESAPPMKGLEFLNAALLASVWDDLDKHVRARLAEAQTSAAQYLHGINPLWNAVGRVTFHLAENKRNAEFPFAFLATYSNRVSGQGKVQHLPLGRALQEYAGAQNRAALSSLLAPVQRAAEQSKLARELLETRAVFHPQTWRPNQAYKLLSEIPLLEQAGLSVRIPDWWKSGRPPRPAVSVRIGEAAKGRLGTETLLDFNVEITLEGEPLTGAEWQAIRQSTDGLALIKGKWVEVDRAKLQEVLDHWTKVQEQVGRDGVSLLEGMRLLSGFGSGLSGPAAGPETSAWFGVQAGSWLRQVLEQMREPQAASESDPGPELHAELRPYQRQGVQWLWFMNRLGLGMCLADDMGLGKTIQIISLLLLCRRERLSEGSGKASILVVPASLLGNWKSELSRFAPSLQVLIVHPSELGGEAMARLAADPSARLADLDLVITTYGLVQRLDWIRQTEWNLAVLDEAQAIKNAGARQTRAVKELRAGRRIALSGTPIENRLSDLWSLFDFICPGLLGGAKQFAAFVKSRSGDPGQFAPLRRLVRPYILRRLKTDKRIISDLPEKTEVIAYCPLGRTQAALYQKSVEEMKEQLESPSLEGIRRRGVVLAFLSRFKQICNHPSHWLGDGAYRPEDSGKFRRLRELAEEIASRQEKVLVFSQYREMTEPLASLLAGIFGQPGLILSGETAVKKRKELVDRFQSLDGPPFFVLSLKAGGAGLNLTAASHVIHFDRWWNPAVENQATDRAFRIGQKRNVLVQKFVCRGTLEERIDRLIAGKKELAEDILGDGAEKLLTEMSNSQLLDFVRLDINAVADD